MTNTANNSELIVSLYFDTNYNREKRMKTVTAKLCSGISRSKAFEEKGLAQYAVKSLFPTDWQYLQINGKLIVKLFRHFRSGA